ncbi:CBM1 domain-containing protein [Plasmodiophora brassicae]
MGSAGTLLLVVVGVLGMQADADAPVYGLRCGPFYGNSGCPSQNGVTQCCSAWGWCSDSSNTAEYCRQQSLNNYYTIVANEGQDCTADAQCTGLNANAKCVTVAMSNGVNEYVGACGIFNVDSGTFAGTNAPSVRYAARPTSDAVTTTTPTVLITVAAAAAVLAIANRL